MSKPSFREAGAPEWRRIGLFLAVAFGVGWAVVAVIFLTGGLTDSAVLATVGGASLTYAAVLLPTGYMFAPAIAVAATVALTDEGWDELPLRVAPECWRSYLAAWLAPAALTAFGAGLFFLLFPRHFDPAMAAAVEGIRDQTGAAVDPTVLLVVPIVAAVSIGPLINGVLAAGEEIGWRGYLLAELWPLGPRRAVPLHGLIWGAWHWPLIPMGYEYGFGYPGAPWSGLAVFPAFTVAAGTFLAWLTVRTDSVWPAALAHGAINAAAGVPALFVAGEPNPLLGPLPVGLVAMVPWLALAAGLLVRERRDWRQGDGGTADVE